MSELSCLTCNNYAKGQGGNVANNKKQKYKLKAIVKLTEQGTEKNNLTESKGGMKQIDNK